MKKRFICGEGFTIVMTYLKSKKARYGSLIFVLALSVIIRAHAIDYRVLWWDELFSWWVTTLSWEGFIHVVHHDINPPFYYAVLSLWSLLFGDSELSLRTMSLFFSTLSMIYVYLTARIYDFNTGIYALLITGFSAFHINYSVEVRAYSLMGLLAIMSLYHFLQFENDNSKIHGIIYVFTAILMLYTHVYGFFVLIAQTIFTINKYRESKDIKSIKPVIYPILASLPLIFHYVSRGILPSSNLQNRESWWLEAPGLTDLTEALQLLSGIEGFMPLFMILAVLTFYSFKKTSNERLENDLTKILWLYFLSIIILPWIVSYVFTPIFRPRYVIAGVLPFYILVSYGISQVADIPIQIMLISAILIGSAAAISQDVYEEDRNEPWIELVSEIEEEYEQGDKLVYSGHWIRFGFSKYGEKDLDMVSVPEQHMYDPRDNYRFQSDERNVINSSDIIRAKNEIKASERVWLILLRERGEIDEFKTQVEEEFDQEEYREYGDVKVTLYQESD